MPNFAGKVTDWVNRHSPESRKFHGELGRLIIDKIHEGLLRNPPADDKGCVFVRMEVKGGYLTPVFQTHSKEAKRQLEAALMSATDELQAPVKEEAFANTSVHVVTYKIDLESERLREHLTPSVSELPDRAYKKVLEEGFARRKEQRSKQLGREARKTPYEHINNVNRGHERGR